MKLLYKRSVVGMAWTLIRPMVQLAVYSFVFQSLLSIKISHYASFFFIGILSWTWFQTSLLESTSVIISNSSLIWQPNFSLAILPIVSVLTGLIHFLLAFPVTVLFLFIEDVTLSTVVLSLPILMILQFVLTISLGYFFAALNVTFRDTHHTLGVLLQLLFWMSGIFYDISALPRNYQNILYINPMCHIITAYRAILIHGIQPDWPSLLVIGVISVGLLPIGQQYFRWQSDRFVEEL
jgi:lipopolysaccharide transport system permease protein